MQYKQLGQTGLRVSELCLGTMTFGDDWGWGADSSESAAQYKVFRDAGGNFIDTANLYTEGSSELILGNLINSHRREVVLATKYSLRELRSIKGINLGGNSRKNMMESVEASLRRLKTDYIDLYYLHAYDGFTPMEEVMRGLDDLVSQGKVLYIGISDTPAWLVSEANTYAKWNRLTQFSALQIEYSLIQRSVEFELTPVAKHFGMTITPWAPIAGGALSGKYLSNPEEQGRVKPESLRRNERSTKIAEQVVAIAKELNALPVQVALRWLMQQSGSVIPIIGARSANQLSQSLGACNIALSDAQMIRLSEVSQLGYSIFPHDFLAGDGVVDLLSGGEQENWKK